MSLRNKIIKLFEAHDLFDQQGSINVDHGEIGERDHLANMWHSYPSTDYAMIEEKGKKMRIFCDMDNVIVDMPGAFKAKVGMRPEPYEDIHGSKVFWNLIESWGEEFWDTLPWMPDGKELWDYINKHDAIILSAATRTYQIVGKDKWIKRELGIMDAPVINPKDWKGQSRITFGRDKWQFMLEPGDILIDDTPKKINPWNEHGGNGILHTSTADTIAKLKSSGF